MMELVLLRIAACLVFGAMLALVYLKALGLNVALYLDSGGMWMALLCHAMRVLAVVAAFALCAHAGALALISSVAGFHVMRTVTISRHMPALAGKS